MTVSSQTDTTIPTLELRGPRVYIGPEDQVFGPDYFIDWMQEAVLEGGGQVVPLAEANAIIWFGKPYQLEKVIHQDIRWVQLPSAGIEYWMDSPLLSRGITFTCAAGAMAETVAEQTLALTMAAARRMHEFARAKTWLDRRGQLIRGSTVLIVGAGGIGQAFIRLLQPMEPKVIAITRTGRSIPGAAESHRPDKLQELLPRADFVVIAAPSTPQTKHLLGRHELGLMKDGAWIVNVSRGELIDTDALLETLRDGRIGGIATDVTDPEPLPDGHPLWDEPRALISPHTGNLPDPQGRRLAERVNENVRRLIDGQPPIGVIELQRGY